MWNIKHYPFLAILYAYSQSNKDSLYYRSLSSIGLISVPVSIYDVGPLEKTTEHTISSFVFELIT